MIAVEGHIRRLHSRGTPPHPSLLNTTGYTHQGSATGLTSLPLAESHPFDYVIMFYCRIQGRSSFQWAYGDSLD